MSVPVPAEAITAVAVRLVERKLAATWTADPDAFRAAMMPQVIADIEFIAQDLAPHIAAAERDRLADLGDQMDEGDAIRAVVADAVAAERERIRQLAEQHHAHYWDRHISADGESYMAESPFTDLLADPSVPAVPAEGTTP